MRALLICALLCACKTAPERVPPQPISADTALHPRFLYASLPELLVLSAAGIVAVLELVSRLRTKTVPSMAE